jgi:hypothetical protein
MQAYMIIDARGDDSSVERLQDLAMLAREFIQI